ncbi:metallopeptidase TldD-related protein [Pseudonocardia spinosispora]|uniref:metallopeptidase TldD-related protein n=1 Tax=Pseudonocardia spinosispora TaxID=103441 RepID=UPI0003FF71F9|nr:metallopeptidase TldD-related protein [Pseudonocardia spinosispora]
MRAQELIERVLEVPAGAGIDAVGRVVLVTESSEAMLRWANNTMTTNGHAVGLDWSVISLIRVSGGTAAGVISSSVQVSDVVEIEAAVRASEAAAIQSGPARDVADLPAPDAGVNDGWEDPAGETTIGVYSRLADQLAEAFGSARDQARVLYGFASHEVATTWLGTSTGVRRRWTQPTGSIELNSKTADLARSAWGGRSTSDFTDIDLLVLDAELTTRLSWGSRRVDLPAGRYPTILPPSCVSDLVTMMAWDMSGRNAQQGRSAFSAANGEGTKVGQKLTELPLTLTSDPTGQPGLATAPFLATSHSSDDVSVFDNGAPLSRVDWISEGRLNALMYPRAAAAEFGTEFAAPGDNLLLTGGSTESLDDLVTATERGLLLTCLWYIREVDPANLLYTGLTRDGVYLVEGGEVVGEVNNFRFNESPLELLRRADRVGASERTLPREFKDWFTRAVMPPMRIPDFNMSSVSQAS